MRDLVAIVASVLLVAACSRNEGAKAGDSPIATASTDSTRPSVPEPAKPSVANVVVDSALTEPQLVLHGSSYQLHLPPAMHAALLAAGVTEIPKAEDYNPAVRRYASDVGPRQALFAVVGDFDGDRRDDVVVHARLRKPADSAQVFMAVLNDSTGAETIEIERYPFYSGPLGEYLLYQKAETIRSRHEKAPLTLKTDAFQVVFFEKAATLYYYQGGKFRQYFTAD